MEEKELIEKIRWLGSAEGGNLGGKLSSDIRDLYLSLPENKEIRQAFRDSKYCQKGWRWHQLVRAILEPPSTRQYMYERLLSLLLKHRKSHEDYFEITNEEGYFRVPNPLADLNKLEILFHRYLELYSRIVAELHFDYPKVEHWGPIIKGTINWSRTLAKSQGEFPLEFSTSIRKREFDTPENILLLLCAEWMLRESNRLLKMKFLEPLGEYKISLLKMIIRRTQLILRDFPIVTVRISSRKYWNLSNSDSRITHLEREARLRINQRLIQNQNYSRLLNWIEEFRQLNLQSISEDMPTRHIIEPIDNIDTIYEIWFFMEFIEFLDEKGLRPDFELGEKPHCKFDFSGHVITLWYEREFSEDGPFAWVRTHKPDFTAMEGDTILAVFDAKNYSKSTDISETKNIMLAYMSNLDTNFGGLIYPNYPRTWEELDKNERLKICISLYAEKYPLKDKDELYDIAIGISRLAKSKLPSDIAEIASRNAKIYHFPSGGRRSRFYHDLTLSLIRMPPDSTTEAAFLRQQSLEMIFQEIVKRVPLLAEK
jgi:hypothetical protein